MLGFGVGFLESIGTVVSSMGNMGPGLGTCGPAYSWSELPDAAKMATFFPYAPRTFGIIYGITALQFRFLEKELNEY